MLVLVLVLEEEDKRHEQRGPVTVVSGLLAALAFSQVHGPPFPSHFASGPGVGNMVSKCKQKAKGKRKEGKRELTTHAILRTWAPAADFGCRHLNEIYVF